MDVPSSIVVLFSETVDQFRRRRDRTGMRCSSTRHRSPSGFASGAMGSSGVGSTTTHPARRRWASAVRDVLRASDGAAALEGFAHRGSDTPSA
jgi:hypothetical protein